MKIEIELPQWLSDINSDATAVQFYNIKDRAQFAIRLSRLNIEYHTGGPFGAAIFDMHTGVMISAGVNLVIPARCSVAHAEMVAIMIAQQKLNCYRLPDSPGYQLISSCQPCAMCMGAIPWSGVVSLVCSARDEDARATGFDEGDKPADWIQKYHTRNIDVTIDILRSQARRILQQYSQQNNPIY